MLSKETNDVILEALIEEIAIRGGEWIRARHETAQRGPMRLMAKAQKAEGESQEQKKDAAMLGVLEAMSALNEFLESVDETARGLVYVAKSVEGGDEDEKQGQDL